MAPGGTLRMMFESDAWDSTISFAAGIPVALGGSLELAFASGVDPLSQIGRTFDVFDWTGVSPTGAFAVGSPYVWDLSKLYTTGEVTFLAASGLPGDFNGDNVVDAADYTVWRDGLSVDLQASRFRRVEKQIRYRLRWRPARVRTAIARRARAKCFFLLSVGLVHVYVRRAVQADSRT